MVYLWTMNANWTKRKCSFITTNNRSENVLTQPIYFLLWNSKGCTENNILVIFVFMQWKWKGLKKGLICLSLSVSIQTCQFVTDAVTLSRIHVHCVEKSNLHSLRFLLLYSTQERTSSGLGTTRCYFWYRELVYVQNARGLWPANESTHAELMPPKLTEGRSGPTTVTAARCTHWHAHLPMVPGAMPSTLTLPRHAGMLSHSWKQEETGLPAYFSHRVLLSFQQLWNETKQWETSESSPHSSWVVKAGAFFFLRYVAMVGEQLFNHY